MATSIVAGEAPRSGRKTTRSIGIVSPITTTKHMAMLSTGFQSLVRASV